MKPKSVLQRMTLLGFMLMTMSVTFANNANEEERNTTKEVVEKTVSRLAALEEDGEPIVIMLDNSEIQSPIPVNVPIREGYVYSHCTIEGDEPECIEEFRGDTRDVVIRIIARYRGRAILKLHFIAVSGSVSLTINIAVEVR